MLTGDKKHIAEEIACQTSILEVIPVVLPEIKSLSIFNLLFIFNVDRSWLTAEYNYPAATMSISSASIVSTPSILNDLDQKMGLKLELVE